MKFRAKKLEYQVTRRWKLCDHEIIIFDSIPECDGQMHSWVWQKYN